MSLDGVTLWYNMGHILHLCIIPQGGNTPLHWACYNGYVTVVEMLLKHGADAKAKDPVSTVPPSSPLYPPMMVHLYPMMLVMMLMLYLYVMRMHHPTG